MSPDDGAWRPSPLQLERDAWRRSRARRSGLLAAASTILVTGIVVAVVTTSPGWPRTRETFFNGSYAVLSLPDILSGLKLNLTMMVVTGVAIFFLALAIAVARTTTGPVTLPLRLAATGFVDIFRGLPLVLVLLLVGFGVPALRLSGLPNAVLFWGGVGLVLSYSAYVAEVIRAGIESVHPSQWGAARGLGLSYRQTLRHVVLPQGIRRVIPALLNDLVSLQKDSALLSLLGIVDATRAAQIIASEKFNFTPYVVAGLCFLVLTIPMTRFVDWYSRRRGLNLAGGF